MYSTQKVIVILYLYLCITTSNITVRFGCIELTHTHTHTYICNCLHIEVSSYIVNPCTNLFILYLCIINTHFVTDYFNQR